MKTVRRPPYPKWNPGYFPCSSLTPPSAFLTPSIGVLRWIRAKAQERGFQLLEEHIPGGWRRKDGDHRGYLARRAIANRERDVSNCSPVAVPHYSPYHTGESGPGHTCETTLAVQRLRSTMLSSSQEPLDTMSLLSSRVAWAQSSCCFASHASLDMDELSC